MEEIKDLTKVIPPKSFERVRKLSRGSGFKLEELYEGLVSDKFQSDEEARTHFYNGKSSYKNYASLKHTLKEILLNAYFLKPKQADSGKLKTVREECYRNLAVIKSLIGNGNRELSSRLTELTIKKCEKYDITDVAYLLSEEMAMYYATIGDPKKSNYYKTLCRDLKNLLDAERELWFVMAEVLSYVSKFRQLKESTKKRLIEEISQKESQYKNFNSYKVYLYRYNILLMTAYLKDDPVEVVKIGNEAIKYFDRLKFKPTKTAYFITIIKTISSYILQGEEKAKEIIAHCISLSPKASYNWNVALLYQAIYGFHFEEYELTKATYLRVIKYTKPENLSQQWNIIGAYLYFLSRIKKIELTTKFRLGKFMNEVPIFEKDKMGANVSILIIHILILLSKGQKGKIIDRIDSLKAYEFAYLRNDHTYRSNCFIKILTKLPDSNFHKVAFQRKAQAFVEKLKARPLSLGDIEIELIPYEQLYDFVLEML